MQGANQHLSAFGPAEEDGIEPSTVFGLSETDVLRHEATEAQVREVEDQEEVE